MNYRTAIYRITCFDFDGQRRVSNLQNLDSTCRAHDCSYYGNDLIINTFMHASALKFSAKYISEGCNYSESNWSIDS